MKEHDDSEENEDDFDDVDVFQKYNSLNLLSRLFLNTLRLAFIFTVFLQQCCLLTGKVSGQKPSNSHSQIFYSTNTQKGSDVIK